MNRVATGRLAVWLRRHEASALARSRTWSTTFGQSCANPAHPKGRTQNGVESTANGSREEKSRTQRGACGIRAMPTSAKNARQPQPLSQP